MTKGKVVQIGIIVSLLGLISYKLLPQIGIDDFTASAFSSFLLILIVITWVSSYIYRVAKEYEKVVNDKLEAKFNALSKEEQKKLMEDLERNL